jgi:hypothetical protein
VYLQTRVENVTLVNGRLSPPEALTLSYYQLSSPNPSTNGKIVSDFPKDAPAADIQAALGTPISSIAQFDVHKRANWIRAQAIRASGRGNGWGVPAGTAVTSDITLTAIRPSADGNNVTQVGAANAGPKSVVVATILASQLDEVLRTFPIGNNGRAFIFTASGSLISSTLTLSATQRIQTNVFQNNDFGLQVPLRTFQDAGFAQLNATDPSLGGIVVPVRPLDAKARINGLTYEMQVQQLNINGLNWFLVLFTLPSDFDGGLVRSEEAAGRTCAWTSMTALDHTLTLVEPLFFYPFLVFLC